MMMEEQVQIVHLRMILHYEKTVICVFICEMAKTTCTVISVTDQITYSIVILSHDEHRTVMNV